LRWNRFDRQPYIDPPSWYIMRNSRIENATIETDEDGSTIQLDAVVEGMKYNFTIDLFDLKNRDEELGINSNDYGAGLPRHLMTFHQNDCMFFDHDETANPRSDSASLTDWRGKEVKN